MGLLDDGCRIEIMMAAADLLRVMIDQDVISWEEIQPVVHVPCHWWNACCEHKHKLRSTTASLAALILTIICHFRKQLTQVGAMFLQTVVCQFPPVDVARTAQFALLILRLFEQKDLPIDESVCVAASLGICKLLVGSGLVLRKRGIDAELKQKLVGLLQELMKNNPEVKKAIDDFRSSEERNNTRLSELLQ
jgi:hypothetical protein